MCFTVHDSADYLCVDLIFFNLDWDKASLLFRPTQIFEYIHFTIQSIVKAFFLVLQ